jgi:hypothetical protein
MFEKTIEFSAPEEYFIAKEEYPIPCRLNIPEWFKKLNTSHSLKTIKGCMPFLDSLTSGYLLKMPQDMYLEHNVTNLYNKQESFYKFALQDKQQSLDSLQINLNTELNVTHPTVQLGDSPLVNKNKNLPFHKIRNPWTIKTPPGYSCLFVPPLNNSDDRFSIIPGIVDTDSYDEPINFPIVINGDKYPTLITTIPKGLPYVQIIPFKRDSWKMTFSKSNKTKLLSALLFNQLRLLNNYKKKFWSKKIWK